ncbi:hypothetical protein BJX63DRAFT_401657 [Aspergillus granulosus]|uniref:Uncharacterized protein n=1 Tax=Aspergillus granulosus TaxID=176169 RepID=A0ABR4H573_9EURO
MRYPDQLSRAGGLGVDMEGDDEEDEDQQMLIVIADRKTCIEGWVLVVAIYHKGQILPVRVREKAREADLLIHEWNNGASLAELSPDGNNQGEELYLNNGNEWE